MNEHLAITLDPRFIGRRHIFEEKLEEIQQKNEYWFRNRVNMITGEYPDKIYNYFRYCYTEDNKIGIYFKETLLLEIRQECMSAFNHLFNSQ